LKNRAAILFFLLLTLFAVAAARCRGATRENGHPRFSGQEYVPLSEWARNNKFTLHWLGRDHALEATNRWSRVLFTTDSHEDARRARINGIEVWLAFPIVYQSGAAYISQVDIRKTIGPLIFPPARIPGTRMKTICLDPGHGGRDPGFRVGGNEEKRYTLLLAQEVRSLLQATGFNVVMTRTTDTYIYLDQRTEIARKFKADLFVSVHFNAVEEGRNEVKGVQTFCCTPAGATSSNSEGRGDTRIVDGNRNDDKNLLLAYQVQKAFLKNLAIEDRGVKRARYEVLREATMPGILIEGGFMSHPAEGRKIFDPAYRRRMAAAIVDGIVAYQRLAEGTPEPARRTAPTRGNSTTDPPHRNSVSQ
jgi:N-acetylmuramoyl-L-alanine amidase